MSTGHKTTSNEPEQASIATRIPPTLASMPSEIKGNIVDCVYNISFPDIKSLSLVNHNFYEICRPWLWAKLHFGYVGIEELYRTLREIVPRHSDHVRSIVYLTSSASGSEFSAEEHYSILLEILRACIRLEQLDFSLRDSESFVYPMYKLIEPISKLKSLISFSFIATPRTPPLKEQFLVSILTELDLLESFTCAAILATTDDPVSPLGLCLSKLKCLSTIDFMGVNVDLSWTQLNWKGRMKKIALKYCGQVTVEVLHQLIQCFASSLYELQLYATPCLHNYWHHERLYSIHNDHTVSKELAAERNQKIKKDLEDGRYNFTLPRLRILHFNFPENVVQQFSYTGFLGSFTTGCKELVELCIIMGSPGITNNFLERLISVMVWPGLRKLRVRLGNSTARSAGLEGLEICCDSVGIYLKIMKI